MKTKLTRLACGLALLGVVSSATAQSTLEITGTGTGTLNGVGFSNESFDWTLTFPSTVAYTAWGPTQPVYATLTSQITLNGGPVINITGSPGLWFSFSSPDTLGIAPMTAIPGSNILSIFAATPGWDGVSAYTSATLPNNNFGQFNSITTDHGSLTMGSGSVSLVTISGIAPVPEPSTLVLAGLGGLGVLWQFRRRK